MSYDTLYLRTATVGNDIKDALRHISDFDNDFSGKNGTEYLWTEVEEHNEKFGTNYDSSMEYLLDTLQGSEEEIVTEFINTWMNHDRNYYHDYKYNIVTKSDGKVAYIALAVTCE